MIRKIVEMVTGLRKPRTCENGYHDWQIVGQMRYDKIHAAAFKRFNGYWPPPDPEFDKRWYLKRVCLRCERVEDEIEPAIQRELDKRHKQEKRMDRAQEILDEILKDE